MRVEEREGKRRKRQRKSLSYGLQYLKTESAITHTHHATQLIILILILILFIQFTEMSRRYDSRTTTFSPEGRLFQVEYAMEAISHAGTVIGILTQQGVVLAAEKKVTSKLLEQDTSSEKIYTVSE